MPHVTNWPEAIFGIVCVIVMGWIFTAAFKKL